MTFKERQLQALDKRLDALASDYADFSFLYYRIFVLRDKKLYPEDWKKRPTSEKNRWLENTEKRTNERLSSINKEVKQLNKFIKSLNK